MVSVVSVCYSHPVSLFPSRADSEVVLNFVACDGTEPSLEYCNTYGFEIFPYDLPALGITCANSCDDNY